MKFFSILFIALTLTQLINGFPQSSSPDPESEVPSSTSEVPSGSEVTSSTSEVPSSTSEVPSGSEVTSSTSEVHSESDVNSGPQDIVEVTGERSPGCPNVPGMTDFSLSEFLGTWFVGYHFEQDLPPCQAFAFQNLTDNFINIGNSIVMSSNVSLTIAGQAYTPIANEPSFMKWRWSYASGYLEDATILDTDYENYAIIVICGSYDKTVRTAGILLSRNFTSTETHITKAKDILSPYIDTSRETKYQEECLAPVSVVGMNYINLNVIYSRYPELAPNLQALRLGNNVTVVN